MCQIFIQPFFINKYILKTEMTSICLWRKIFLASIGSMLQAAVHHTVVT